MATLDRSQRSRLKARLSFEKRQAFRIHSLFWENDLSHYKKPDLVKNCLGSKYIIHPNTHIHPLRCTDRRMPPNKCWCRPSKLTVHVQKGNWMTHHYPEHDVFTNQCMKDTIVHNIYYVYIYFGRFLKDTSAYSYRTFICNILSNVVQHPWEQE